MIEDKPVSKMYVLVRQDLSPGYQIAQAIHAKDQFTHTFPKEEREWWENSNTIVVLGIPNLESLYLFHELANDAGLLNAMFYEPDIDEHTAIAIQPGEATAELVRSLRPAGRGYRQTTR